MEKQLFIKEIMPLREKLIRYALQFLRNDSEAEDIVQEVYIRLWGMGRALHEYDNKLALSYRITKNLCINRMKSKQYGEQGMDNVIAASAVDLPDHQLEHRDSAAHVMRIIDDLPSIQQAVLKMRHVDGLEIQEIAELTGSTAEAIRANLSRGRRRVKELFLKVEDYGTK